MTGHDNFAFSKLSRFPGLEAIGQQLYEARAQYMLDTNQGLTKTYNALKNPGCDEARILELRRMHEEMDRAVLHAWGDVVVPSYCRRDEEEKGLVGVFEDEVIDRLYLLNGERAREEERLGKRAGGKGKGKGAGKSQATEVTVEKKGLGKKKTGGGQGELF